MKYVVVAAVLILVVGAWWLWSTYQDFKNGKL